MADLKTGATPGRELDFSLTGRMLTPCWIACGLSFLITALLLSSAGRWIGMGLGVVAILFGLALLPVPWDRVPPVVPRSVPYIATAVLGLCGHQVSGAQPAVAVACTVLLAWTGLALPLTDLVLCTALSAIALTSTFWSGHTGFGTAIGTTLAAMPLMITTGGLLHWLRRCLDAAATATDNARSATAQAEEQARRQQEAAERERADRATEELARQQAVSRDIGVQATALLDGAGTVRERTSTITVAMTEMAGAISEISRAAQNSDTITAEVAQLAETASGVMNRLEASNDEIIGISEVIQAIAQQTDLLALNATIESARAGEAGRGFAVVAGEVKELARQSGDNADRISTTLAKVRSDVAEAVERVQAIVARIDALRTENGALAAAAEQQSAAAREVTQSVEVTAGEAGRIASSATALADMANG